MSDENCSLIVGGQSSVQHAAEQDRAYAGILGAHPVGEGRSYAEQLIGQSSGERLLNTSPMSGIRRHFEGASYLDVCLAGGHPPHCGVQHHSRDEHLRPDPHTLHAQIVNLPHPAIGSCADGQALRQRTPSPVRATRTFLTPHLPRHTRGRARFNLSSLVRAAARPH
jgi:hypothetical protein